MKNEQKILNCLYIIIAILMVNSICLFVVVSKIGDSNSKTTNQNAQTSTETNTYDVSMFTAMKSSEVTKKIKSGDKFLLFIGKSNCAYCQKILPVLQQAQTNYKYTTVYLDINQESISSAEYQEMAALLDVKKTVNNETKEFGKFQYTPMIAVINNGKMIDGMIGYNTYENISSFLENAGIKK